jgi:hypothetical protein
MWCQTRGPQRHGGRCQKSRRRQGREVGGPSCQRPRELVPDLAVKLATGGFLADLYELLTIGFGTIAPDRTIEGKFDGMTFIGDR